MPGLYVHIPFCQHKCMYCDFHSETEMSQTDKFVDACIGEIRQAGPLVLASPDTEFSSVFFGGGTPSLLTEKQIGSILQTLRQTFVISPQAECSMEVNPGTIDYQKLDAMRKLGINRLSFGVQSFFDADLLMLERIHTSDEAKRAIEMARQAGFDNISIDLLFSLPDQTPERLAANLEAARSLGVPHISCYSLTVEPGTPLDTLVRRGHITLPAQELDAELYELTMETLAGWGYEHYEVSNYSLEGYRCRHNLTYWRQEDYLGFGPSAHSTWNGRRWWNVENNALYYNMIQSGDSALAGREQLTMEQKRAEHIFLALRSEGIVTADFRIRFKTDFIEDNGSVLEQLNHEGFLALSPPGCTVRHAEHIAFTHKGFLLCDEICARLV